uniref:Uncharacterized protein n=1 Tax=Rhizochromulina marina TaxID=1034831 RepID=A0A7S2R8D9_9STRA
MPAEVWVEPRAHLVTALASDGTSFEALLGHREHLGVLLLSLDRGAQVGTDCVLLINTFHHHNCYTKDRSQVRQDTPLWVRDMLTPHLTGVRNEAVACPKILLPPIRCSSS